MALPRKENHKLVPLYKGEIEENRGGYAAMVIACKGLKKSTFKIGPYDTKDKVKIEIHAALTDHLPFVTKFDGDSFVAYKVKWTGK